MIKVIQKFLTPRKMSETVLIVGLGNVGAEFEDTRHNAGFLAVDSWRKAWGLPIFSSNKKLFAQVAQGKIGVGGDIKSVILAQPTTMMNRSGAAVNALMAYYRIARENVIVVHDDADLSIGTVKATDNSGDAGHNGIRDIISVFGTQEFRRIRLGVRPQLPPQAPRQRAISFVLRPFAQNERDILDKVIHEVGKELIGSL